MLPSLSLRSLDRSVITTYAPAKPVYFGQYTSGLAWTLGRSSRCRSYRQEATPISQATPKKPHMLQVRCATHPAGFFPSRSSLLLVARLCSSSPFEIRCVGETVLHTLYWASSR